MENTIYNSEFIKTYLDINYILNRVTKVLHKENKYKVKGPCWEWNLSKSQGYGKCSLNLGKKGKKFYNTHRLSYSFYVGQIKEGMHICHKCDNPACCNPEHLFQGTHEDNMKDMGKKGRQGVKPQFGNNYAGKRVLAGGIEFQSVEEAGKYYKVSGNAIKKRIKTGKEGYKYL